MWVSEQALASSLAKGTDSRAVTSGQRAHTHTHTHARVQTPTDGDKDPNTGTTPGHADRQKKSRQWRDEQQTAEDHKPKTQDASVIRPSTITFSSQLPADSVII